MNLTIEHLSNKIQMNFSPGISFILPTFCMNLKVLQIVG